MSPSFWQRVRQARLLQVLLVYGSASWLLLEVTDVFVDKFGLPSWIFPTAFLLLLIGLLIVVSTAWVQAQPHSQTGAELPSPWAVDIIDLKESVTQGRMPSLTWGRAVAGGVVVFVLLFGVTGLYVFLHERTARVSAGVQVGSAAPGIAVLPFRVADPELELWREGIIDALYYNLDGVAGLRAISPRAVLSRWHSEVGTGHDADDPRQLIAVAQGLGAAYALSGSIIGTGGDVRITAEVHDLDLNELRRAQVEGSADSVLTLVDRLSVEILRTGLIADETELPQLDLSSLTTRSLPALKAYLQGEQQFRRGLWDEAIAELNRAVEADSSFALAHYRLSLAYSWRGTSGTEKSLEHSRLAARYSDRLPDRVALLLRGRALLEEDLAGIDTLEELTRRYPDDVDGWYALGEAYLHQGDKALYTVDDADRAFRSAIALDASFSPAYIHLVEHSLHHRDSASAMRLMEGFREAGGASPANPEYRAWELLVALTWGDSVTRERVTAGLDTVESEVLRTAYVTALAGTGGLSEQGMAITRALMDPRRPTVDHLWGHFGTGRFYLARGQLQSARDAFLASAELAGQVESFETKTNLLWYIWDHGVEASARKALRTAQTYWTPRMRFYIGALAASDGHWDDVERELEWLEAAAARAEASQGKADSLNAIGYAGALRCYAALRRGDLARATMEFKKLAPGYWGPFEGPDHQFLRYELGRALLEQGEPMEAERYLRSLELSQRFGVPAQYYLGRVYEELGDTEQAKLSYGRFVRAWEDCDPELRPRWERGSEALARLTADTGG